MNDGAIHKEKDYEGKTRVEATEEYPTINVENQVSVTTLGG